MTAITIAATNSPPHPSNQFFLSMKILAFKSYLVVKTTDANDDPRPALPVQSFAGIDRRGVPSHRRPVDSVVFSVRAQCETAADRTSRMQSVGRARQPSRQAPNHCRAAGPHAAA